MVFWLRFYFAPKKGFRKENDRFEMKIWNLKRLKWKPSDDWTFSQRRGHFVAKAHFRSQWQFLQLRNGTREPKVGFATAKWGLGRENEILKAWGISQLRNGTRVPRGCFAAAKIFVWGNYGAAKWFRSKGPISQRTPDFATSTLWLRNYFAEDDHFRKGLFWAAKFRRPLKFLTSELLLAPRDLPSPLLQFLLN